MASHLQLWLMWATWSVFQRERAAIEQGGAPGLHAPAQGRGTHICMNAHGFAHGTLGNRVIPTGHLSRDTPRGFVQRTGQFRSLGTRAADSPRLPSKPVLWRESVGGFDSRPPPQRGFYLQKRVAHRLDGHGL